MFNYYKRTINIKMSYYFNKTFKNKSFDQAIIEVTEILKSHGFGIITEINVKNTLKEKIDVDFKKYTILGACNPTYAYEALQKEDKIGLFLPCNVVIQETKDGGIDVSAVDPIASMQSVENQELGKFAFEVQNKMKMVIEQMV